MKNRPWYIWFSFFGLIVLLCISMFQYFPMFSKNKNDAMNTWLSLCGNVFLTWFALFMLPLGVIIGLIIVVSQSVDLVGIEILGKYGVAICMYFLGVYSAYKHVQWRNLHQTL